jgi:protein ImuA
LARQGRPKAEGAVLPFGLDMIDHHLPGGGLRLAGLHEVADVGLGLGLEHSTAAGLMVVRMLARLEGPVLWPSERSDLFAPPWLMSG